MPRTAYRIAVIPGDGIGKEVMPEALRALDAVSRRFDITLDYEHIADDMRTQSLVGVPYTAEMIAKAKSDIVSQATTDDPGQADLVKRYRKALSRDFDGRPGELTEMDALVAYLQVLGTMVDFKTYDDKANIR